MCGFPVRAQISNTNIAIKIEAIREQVKIQVRKQQGSPEECGSGKVSPSERRNNNAEGIRVMDTARVVCVAFGGSIALSQDASDTLGNCVVF